MNREKALRILLSLGPHVKDGSNGALLSVVRQAAELIASEATRTSDGPLKDYAGFRLPLTINGRLIEHDEQKVVAIGGKS